MMHSHEVRKKYLSFFTSGERRHVEIPSASLVPANDPTTLFTGSGMQPLLPYLLGEKHPKGDRLVDSQKCFRAEDIEEVGDNRHTTFFEMLGNWSLGSYWKKEQLAWFLEFLTKEIGISKDRLWVTCFEGDATLGLPRDDESANIWKTLGIPDDRTCFYGAKKNWWSRSGEPEKMPAGEPGGPDSEVFFDFGERLGLHDQSSWKDEECHPNCDCGRFMEIGNSVFMQYIKKESGSFGELPQKNVDFGGGLERITAAANDDSDVFRVDSLRSVISILEEQTGTFYDSPEYQESFRVVADHMRAAIFMVGDGVMPSNTEQGYFVRRLIRRSMTKLHLLGVRDFALGSLAHVVAERYARQYPALTDKEKEIDTAITNEVTNFHATLAGGLKKFEKMSTSDISGKDAFILFSTYGFPLELAQELAVDRGVSIDVSGFREEMARHQELSRKGAEQKFKGGLADTSEMSVKYHTATHLLHQALRDTLGDHVYQKGSNITPERLRFDFSHDAKMTDEAKKKVEDMVNEKIREGLPVTHQDMSLEEAEQLGAIGLFGEKYGDLSAQAGTVRVYTIGDPSVPYSREYCGGPHVSNTGELGLFRIKKEEAASAGIRRIKAVLEQAQCR